MVEIRKPHTTSNEQHEQKKTERLTPQQFISTLKGGNNEAHIRKGKKEKKKPLQPTNHQPKNPQILTHRKI